MKPTSNFDVSHDDIPVSIHSDGYMLHSLCRKITMILRLSFWDSPTLYYAMYLIFYSALWLL